MNKNIDCEVVRDLLPSYVDGLTSEVTNKTIEEHMEECADCGEALRRMKEPETGKIEPIQEVDYLKKVRRRTSIAGMVCGIVLMLIGAAVVLFNVFFVGTKAKPSDLNYSVSVSDDTVHLSGSLVGSGSAVSRVEFTESAGSVDITVYTAPKTIFNNGFFSKEYEATDRVNGVRLGDLIIWEDGVQISRTASELFSATNPFVGDMPSNTEVADILGVYDQFGPYTNELQTAAEPYIWTIVLENEIADDEERAAKEIMAADSYAMMAAIENLGGVTWRYKTQEGEREYALTVEQASEFAGKDIKLFAASPSKMQALTEKLSIKWSGVREVLQEDGEFRIKLLNGADGVYSMGMNYYLDGKLVGGSGCSYANDGELKKGDTFDFTFTPKDFPKGTTAAALSEFSFDLTLTDANGNTKVVCENRQVYAKYAWSYFYSLSGNFQDGFTLVEG